MPASTLGPFTLESPIGTGAMGEVWKAHHTEGGTPVAIKVMTAKSAILERQRQSFFNEVRAVAQLDHPGIAWILDYGLVDAAATENSEGRLITGSPYLVMEHASRGTLADIRNAYNWTELRSVLLALLDALAHAHARQVIHRDLKPANVLLCSRNDLRPGLKLCDFGIALAMDDVHDTERVAGTLHYMSPEQIEGNQRNLGPYTDLYSFGCLTWRLLMGSPPFWGKRQAQLMFAHLREKPPPLFSPTPIPDGFEKWLRTLLEKDPADRFRCAADAASALVELGHPAEATVEDTRTGILRPVILTHDVPQSRTLEPDPNTVVPSDTAILAAQPITLTFTRRTLGANVRSGVPLDWRRPARARPTLDLVGVGLHLFGLRRPPFVGRESERDVLWDVLTRVHREQRAHCVVLTGTPGVGKSRLATWMGERCAEVGAGQLLSARFNQADDLEGPLRSMLLRHFQARGLEGEELDARIDDSLDELGVGDGEIRTHAKALLRGERLEGASRHVVIRLLLEALSNERPCIVVLDDVHEGVDGLRFARHLLSAASIRPFPILVVLTCQRDALDEGGLQAEFDALVENKRCEELSLAPLSRENAIDLVQQLLGLEPALAGDVARRTAGNPLFAIQLIGDWVEQERLELGTKGFRLRAGDQASLPSDIDSVWTNRLSRVLERVGSHAESMLEAAAVLGMEVDELEWAGMCDDPEGYHRDQGRVVVVPENARQRFQLTDALFEMRLAVETEFGFAFQHGQFREAILQRARTEGRIKQYHHWAACQLGPQAQHTELERFGRHLLAAGQLEAAVDPLLRAVPAVRGTVGRMSAWRLLDTVEATLTTVELPRSDRRWGRLYVERSEIAGLLGKDRIAVKWAAMAGKEAARHGWSVIASRANFRLACAAMGRGNLDVAQARLIRLTRRIDPERHPFLVGESLFLLGRIERQLNGDPAKARKLIQTGKGWMMKDRDPQRRARAMIHLARAALEDGQLETCASLIDRAQRIAEDLGDLPQQVDCLGFAAEVCRANADLQGAADRLRRAIEVYELIGDADLGTLRTRLAIVLLDQGLQADALKVLDRGLANAIEVGRSDIRLAVQSARIRALAELGGTADLDEALAATESIQHDLSADDRRTLETAVRALHQRGDTVRVTRIHRLLGHRR